MQPNNVALTGPAYKFTMQGTSMKVSLVTEFTEFAALAVCLNAPTEEAHPNAKNPALLSL